jgi:hypothetical protein
MYDCVSDVDLSSRQTIFMEAFAVVTMAIYLGFIHLLMSDLCKTFLLLCCRCGPETPETISLNVPVLFADIMCLFLYCCAADVDLSSRQTIFMEAFAVVTMAIYLGFIHLLGVLLLGSFFRRTCLLLLIGGCCCCCCCCCYMVFSNTHCCNKLHAAAG